jgi:hypothetical protein
MMRLYLHHKFILYDIKNGKIFSEFHIYTYLVLLNVEDFNQIYLKFVLILNLNFISKLQHKCLKQGIYIAIHIHPQKFLHQCLSKAI